MQAAQLAPYGGEPHLEAPYRLMEVGTIGFRPKLQPDDVVLVVKQNRFSGDGLYILDNGHDPELFRCQSNFRDGVEAFRDDPRLGRYTFPREVFNGMLIGRVAMIGQVQCRRLLQEVLCPP